MKKLAEEIIAGKRLTSLDFPGHFITADLNDLCAGADMIRSALCGDQVSLCTIINGKSGRCSEDCRFCAQSAHHHTQISEYGFLDGEEILRESRYIGEKGVRRFAVVTAGKSLCGDDLERVLEVFRTMKNEGKVEPCASFGFLTDEQFSALKAAGVGRIHCNIETSRRNFPNICTTHTFDDKIACIKRAQAAGLEVCSGGIIGMGETWEDRIDMALTLAELGINSIPINVLTPIKGTVFGDIEPLNEADILRTIAIFRYIIPTAFIRLAAGRNRMKNSGERAFRSGANAAITGDMLTTSGSGISADMEMLTGMGFRIV